MEMRALGEKGLGSGAFSGVVVGDILDSIAGRDEWCPLTKASLAVKLLWLLVLGFGSVSLTLHLFHDRLPGDIAHGSTWQSSGAGASTAWEHPSYVVLNRSLGST